MFEVIDTCKAVVVAVVVVVVAARRRRVKVRRGAAGE